MDDLAPMMAGLAVALGIGLLIGAERERRKGEGPARAVAGIRTFVIASLLGAVAALTGGPLLVAVAVSGVFVLTGIGYAFSHREDPGLTTEITLSLVVLLGAMATRQPIVAAAAAVTVAVILAARSQLHHFVRTVLSEEELHSALTFAAATLIVLPLVPDRFYGPFEALNPHTLWLIVILMMAISAAGYVAIRLLGARAGLPLAGFAAGFVSSAAAIAALGARAKATPALTGPAAAGAVSSTVATIVQLAFLLAITSPGAFADVARPLAFAGAAAVAYSAVIMRHALEATDAREPGPGRAFDLMTALKLAATLAAILLSCAALKAWFGSAGLFAASAIGGFADTHAPALSVGQLVSAGKLAAGDAAPPVLIAMTTNTISKAVIAQSSGGRDFTVQVVPGLVLVIVAAWLGTLPMSVPGQFRLP